jgi:hypothetical protein
MITPRSLSIFRFKTDGVSPIADDQKTLVHRLRIVGGHLELIGDKVVAGAAVQASLKSHPDGIEIFQQLLFGKVFGAVEGHMLTKMGQAFLIFILLNAAAVYIQPQFSPLFRHAVGLDVIGEAVFQFSITQIGVHGHRGGQIHRQKRHREQHKKQADAKQVPCFHCSLHENFDNLKGEFVVSGRLVKLFFFTLSA